MLDATPDTKGQSKKAASGGKKKYGDKTALVYDHGLFVELARTLAQDFGRVYYYAPWENGYPKSNSLLIGEGLEGVTRVSTIWNVMPEVDIVVFPDVYEGALQAHLVSLGKRVWGCRMGEELELDRIASKRFQAKLGIDIGPYVVVKGLDALREYLKTHEDVYVKISATRGDCFDDKTDIFTKDGWRRFEEIDLHTELLTMDPETSETLFVKPTAYIKRWHDGPMIRVNGKQNAIDALVTTNHCFWAKTVPGAPWRYQGLPSLGKHAFRIPQAFKWRGEKPSHHRVTNVFRTSERDDRVIPIRDWLEFLGWFVAEGSLSLAGADRTRYRITVSQSLTSNPAKHAELGRLLAKLGYNVQREGDVGFSIYDKSLFIDLESTCYVDTPLASHTKRVPRDIKQLSPELIEVFLSSYAKGDGCVDKRSGQIRYYTTSPHLADDIQELVFKAGRAASISQCASAGDVGGINKRGVQIIARRDGYCVGVKTRSPYLCIRPDNLSRVDYHGYVYDVTVEPHHCIFVRRNGRAFWSGNCETFRSKNYKLIEPRLDELEHNLGAKKKIMQFIVEDAIHPAVECGYDGFTIDGKFAKNALYGIEIKDKGYIGRTKKYDDLPKEVTDVNAKLAPAFKNYQYRGFFSTELRITPEHRAYSIDPCTRQGSPPSELYMLMIENISEVIFEGAGGVVVEPKYRGKWGAELLIHSSWAERNWQGVEFPEEISANVKLRNLAIVDGRHYVVPPDQGGVPEIGAIVAFGDTMEEAVEECKELAGQIEGHWIEVHADALDEAQDEIDKLKEFGIDF